MLRIPLAELVDTLSAINLKLGLTAARASLCARIFAESSRDGVQSHGLNRFPRFAANVRDGIVDPSATPTLVTSAGASAAALAIERWNGNRGPGILNAHTSMDRAVSLARQHGIGAVALANTNHWMRGGTYGWQAADQGLFAICWTNTCRNLPAWGATTPTLGNNPLVLAAPRTNVDGATTGAPHVVLDMAMSQFSYGQLWSYARRGEQLPLPGGYDTEGKLTEDPAAIVKSVRPLPMGFWKGSGLALTLDLFAAALSGGNATHQIGSSFDQETGLSQFFLAIDPAQFASAAELNQIATALVEDLHEAPPTDAGKIPRYPGEETYRLRQENLRLGVPVDDDIWNEVNTLL